jgi:tRNA (mo5U34)-methyltransferase
MLNKETAIKLVQSKSWLHDFEIIPGVRTRGLYDPSGLLNKLQLPNDMSGLTLADIGASNGYFSFVAHQRGAQVVAFDFRHKDNSGFGLAQFINGLRNIEHHHINVLDITPTSYGQFDIVLALGLLYHVADPYRALANCAALSRERLIIESYCIDYLLPRSLASEPVMQFIIDPKRFQGVGPANTDRSNFWGFTAMCLQRMLEDVGFRVRKKNVSGDRVLIDAKRAVFNDQNTRLNIAYGSPASIPLNGSPDNPESWVIF